MHTLPSVKPPHHLLSGRHGYPSPLPRRTNRKGERGAEKGKKLAAAAAAAAMQRLSLGSPAGRPSRVSAAGEEEAGPADEKAAKAVARGPAAPDRAIHLVPVLTLLCFLVLFLLSHDPSAAALTDSTVLAAAATATARSLDAATAGAADATTASSGVYRRLKQSRVRRLGMARRRL
ncbi:uncharacterized protein LOC120687197 [Panicum virgatum]|uniref:Uncharacterized protein n=1 Tax=Panicum virgatum TaxID=38727 RepID=A0A8T0MRL8_PANVG|nr:uncharacterized protein LOC120687197 [Panicum virgatum]KAG2539133.1 hypothetical protein PVAP13_9NG362400 [Panicum virgatum]